MLVIGLDYGKQHIGVAAGDTLSGIVTPIGTISHSHDPIQDVKRFIASYTPQRLIIGVSENTSQKDAQRFSRLIQQHCSIPIDLVDETLSTREAKQKLFHQSRKYRTTQQHAAAAAVILDRWLEDQEYTPLL